MRVNTFEVIGAGQMGGGILQVTATSGMNVIFREVIVDLRLLAEQIRCATGTVIMVQMPES